VTTSSIAHRENRFEAWLASRRSNYLVLFAGLLMLWLVVDSLAAGALVLAGLVPADQFFVTRIWHRPAVLDPEARRIVALRGPSTAGYMDRFEADGLLGQRLVPGFLTTTPPPWGGWVTPAFWFMTNPQGFPPVLPAEAALKPYVVPKPAGTFRAIILGGSTVEGNGVDSPLDSLPAKLRARLARAFDGSAHPGFQHFELINAGVSNYASDQEYLHLLADLLRYQPDLVLVYDGWNDSEVLPPALGGEPATGYYRPGSQRDNADRVNRDFSTLGSLADFASLASRRLLEATDGFASFYGLHKGMSFAVKTVKGSTAAPAPSAPFDFAASNRAAELYVKNRDRMLFLAGQEGFRFASILQPVMAIDQKPYAPTERQILDHITPTQRKQREAFYNAVRSRLVDFAKDRSAAGKVCFQDVSTTSFADHPEQLYADSGHLTAAGNDIVAARIMDGLAACRLLWPAG